MQNCFWQRMPQSQNWPYFSKKANIWFWLWRCVFSSHWIDPTFFGQTYLVNIPTIRIWSKTNIFLPPPPHGEALSAHHLRNKSDLIPKKSCSVRQNSPKNIFFCAAISHHLLIILFLFFNLRPLISITFPQGFRISKFFGHPTSGSGGKIGLKI